MVKYNLQQENGARDVLTLGAPIFGLTSNLDKNKIVAAIAGEDLAPGFAVYSVEIDEGFPVLTLENIIGKGAAQFGTNKNSALLGIDLCENKQLARANTAQITADNKLLYLMSGDCNIRVLDLISGEKKILGKTKKPCDYFTQLTTGEIVTLENVHKQSVLRVYSAQEDNLEEKAFRCLTDFEPMRFDVMYSAGLPLMTDATYVKGLAQIDKQLVMITEQRSDLISLIGENKKSYHGIYAIDFSTKGIIESINERTPYDTNPNMKYLKSLGNITGNGIAPIYGGILISQNNFSGTGRSLGGPSKIVYLPIVKDK